MGTYSKTGDQLAKHLRGGEAFMPVDEMLKEIPFDQLGVRPKDLPYSFYELFYHVWYTQKDILDYCTADAYSAPTWPEEYWPEERAPETIKDWEQLKSDYLAQRQELIDLAQSSEENLLEPVRPGTDHSLLRELLLVIEHTAYHSGQMLILLRHLGLHSS